MLSNLVLSSAISSNQNLPYKNLIFTKNNTAAPASLKEPPGCKGFFNSVTQAKEAICFASRDLSSEALA